MHQERTKAKGILVTVLLLLFAYTEQQAVTWSQIPSVRTGQISTILTLTTASDPVTDQTATFDTPIATSNFAQLEYGVSLMSYQSWMTDTFSFNTSVVSFGNSSITVRFQLLDNTFFTKAKIHYMVLWRPGTFPNKNIPASPPLNPSPSGAYNNIDVAYGCYLTATLLSGSGTRVQTIGGIIPTNIYGSNHSQLVVYSMIAGMQLTNSQGNNDQVKVDTILNGTLIYYQVSVENNNFLNFICLTTVIYDPWVDKYYMKSIIEHETMSLTSNNTGLASIQYAERFDGPSRMFFGFSHLNLSMADTRYLNIETSNISLISQYYEKNAAMNEVVVNMLFFAFRTCFNTSQFYYPINFTCIDTCPSNSIPYPTPSNGSQDFRFCNPCHYSCDTCTAGQDSNACSACPSPTTSFRSPSGSSCPCDPTYTDVGETNCVLCSQAMPGCVSCTSSTVCLDCDNITYVLNTTSQRCGCSTGYYMASSYCLSYSGCLTAAKFNNTLACLSCDTSLNYIRVGSNYSCTCNEGYFLNTSVPECYDICGDGITAKGHCDDNNTDYGDGCDENCNVENGYHCDTVYNNTSGQPGISKCILITSVTVTYLYSKRIINTNSFVMAVKVSPMKDGLTSSAFNSTTFVTSMPIQNQKITYDPNTQTVFLEADYLQPLEANSYTLKIIYPNDYTYYADSTVTQITTTGINAELILDSNPSINEFLPYLLIFQGILTIVLALLASIFGLKLAGLELLLPIQLIYFSLAAIGPQSSYVSSLANLKYSNGYSVIVTYDYFRTYSQNKNLVAMTYESEFLLSTNIMLGVFVIALIWLLVHHLRIKSKEEQIDKLISQRQPEPQEKQKNKDINSDDSEDKEGSPEMDEERAKLSRKKPRNDEQLEAEHELREDHHYSLKIFSFQVDRVYYISYVILINQMLFGFIVMSLNLPLTSFYFSEELSVIICNFLTFIFLGNIVFIFYDQTSNKMITFTCIQDRYAYLHLMFNTIIILLLSYTFESSFGIYIATALSASFLILVIVQRPYCKDFIEFENLVAFYMGCMLLACQILLCIIKSSNLTDSLELVIVIVIAGLIFAGQVLTIIRIVLKVNFKKVFDDLKNPYKDRDSADKKKMRVKQKNLDLLDKQDVEILPPDSVRNGLFTPKDKMIDWQARNTEEYESARLKDVQNKEDKLQEQKPEGGENQNEQASQNKDEKLNELQLLKKRLRNTLRIKRDNQSKKTD